MCSHQLASLPSPPSELLQFPTLCLTFPLGHLAFLLLALVQGLTRSARAWFVLVAPFSPVPTQSSLSSLVVAAQLGIELPRMIWPFGSPFLPLLLKGIKSHLFLSFMTWALAFKVWHEGCFKAPAQKPPPPLIVVSNSPDIHYKAERKNPSCKLFLCFGVMNTVFTPGFAPRACCLNHPETKRENSKKTHSPSGANRNVHSGLLSLQQRPLCPWSWLHCPSTEWQTFLPPEAWLISWLEHRGCSLVSVLPAAFLQATKTLLVFRNSPVLLAL